MKNHLQENSSSNNDEKNMLKITVNGASLGGKVGLSKTLANVFLTVKYQTNSFKNQE